MSSLRWLHPRPNDLFHTGSCFTCIGIFHLLYSKCLANPREKVVIHLSFGLISSTKMELNPLGSKSWTDCVMIKRHWTHHRLLFYFSSLCQWNARQKKGTILTLASRLQVDGQLLILAVFEQNESLSFQGRRAAWAVRNHPDVSSVTFSLQSFSWCASSEQLAASAAIK